MIDHAIEVIASTYGERVRIKDKFLSKFGRFASLGTAYETVQEQGGLEVKQTDNLIDTVVSDNAGDNQSVRIEGHTIDGSGNLTFTVQTPTLNGTTNVTLSTPLARATRITNEGSTDFAGTVTIFDATTPATIFLQADGTHNRSQKAATSISSKDYWIITGLYGAVEKKAAASADFSLQVKKQGGVFQEVFGFTASSSAVSPLLQLTSPIIVPSNSDVRLNAAASTSGVEVVGRIEGYLAIDEAA